MAEEKKYQLNLNDSQAAGLIQIIDVALKATGAQYIILAHDLLQQMNEQSKKQDPEKT